MVQFGSLYFYWHLATGANTIFPGATLSEDPESEEVLGVSAHSLKPQMELKKTKKESSSASDDGVEVVPLGAHPTPK